MKGLSAGRCVKLPVTISYEDEVYRPAGYRVPFVGEQYVAKDGHIRVRKAADGIKGDRLIVRVFDAEKDFKS